MDTHRIISNQASQYIFEREPPYKKESLMRAMGKEVQVEYNLKKVEMETKTVKQSEDVKPPNLLPKEKVGEILKKVLDKHKDFDLKSSEEQNFIIADLINGKYDEMIFGEDDVKSS